jgi:anti-sigma B factor antagonist
VEADSPAFEVVEGADADGTPVLSVTGDLDLVSAPALDRRFAELARQGGQRAVVDLANVTFIDSSGVRAIISGHQLLQQHSSALVLRSPSAATRRLLELTGLDGVLSIEDSPA